MSKRVKLYALALLVFIVVVAVIKLGSHVPPYASKTVTLEIDPKPFLE